MRREPVKHLLTKLAFTLDRDSARLELKWMKQALSPSDPPTALLAMLDRRLRGEPLQYILGTTPFGPLQLLTRPPTLIPRPETEDWTLRLANTVSPSSSRPISVLDLCTGSGCIPLLLCHLWPPGSTRAVGVDISPDAIQLATDNAARCKITAHVTSNLRNSFIPVLGNLHDPDLIRSLEPPFDVVTSNPPYIPKREYDELPHSVKDYEDPRALLGDPPGSSDQDGLSFYRAIASFIARKGVLRNGAIVALEVGHGQAEAVQDILHHVAHLGNTEIWRDPWEKKRVVFARA
ncbi:S-adenosyl-L-methionine-dependent methyltransferase [Melanogaster broomeanus]|nr:S-adenosyl-L-methionine-dependent methyltransferase [Melanogaster broomeanus]